MTGFAVSAQIFVVFAARAGRTDVNDLIVSLIVVIVILAAAGWAGWQRLQQYRGRGIHHPRRLFISLCRAHALDRNHQRLLSDLAQFHQLKHPGSLFLQPELFDSLKLGSAFEPHRAALEKLRQQLFTMESLPAKISQSSQIPK
jgi:hypothetical protein